MENQSLSTRTSQSLSDDLNFLRPYHTTNIEIRNKGNLITTPTLIRILPDLYQEGGIVMARDPVCGMEVNEKTAQWKSEYKGKTYYFCAERCKQVFDKKPDSFVK